MQQSFNILLPDNLNLAFTLKNSFLSNFHLFPQLSV